MRRYESRVWQKRLPGAANLDQVVTVCTIAVYEHDELTRGTLLGREARSVEFIGHF
jgi:hypothetical protein